MDRSSVLAAAEKAIKSEREKQYGSAEKNFSTIAVLWNNYITAKHNKTVYLTREDVANMMILLKVARNTGEGSLDSYIDIAGYAALGAEMAELEVTSKAAPPEKINKCFEYP